MFDGHKPCFKWEHIRFDCVTLIINQMKSENTHPDSVNANNNSEISTKQHSLAICFSINWHIVWYYYAPIVLSLKCDPPLCACAILHYGKTNTHTRRRSDGARRLYQSDKDHTEEKKHKSTNQYSSHSHGTAMWHKIIVCCSVDKIPCVRACARTHRTFVRARSNLRARTHAGLLVRAAPPPPPPPHHINNSAKPTTTTETERHAIVCVDARLPPLRSYARARFIVHINSPHPYIFYIKK